jgi:hypothetical protein
VETASPVNSAGLEFVSAGCLEQSFLPYICAWQGREDEPPPGKILRIPKDGES